MSLEELLKARERCCAQMHRALLCHHCLHMHSSASVPDTDTLQKNLVNKAWKKYYFHYISHTRFPNLYWDRLLQANNMLLLVPWNNSLQEISLSLFFTDWKQNSKKVRMCSCSGRKRRRDGT